MTSHEPDSFIKLYYLNNQNKLKKHKNYQISGLGGRAIS